MYHKDEYNRSFTGATHMMHEPTDITSTSGSEHPSRQVQLVSRGVQDPELEMIDNNTA